MDADPTNTRDAERRKLNIVEGLVLFVLTSLLAGVLWLAKNTIELTVQVRLMREDAQATSTAISGLPDRVRTLEVKGEAQIKRDQDQDDALRELRQMRGLK